jgi:hypothetical protein
MGIKDVCAEMGTWKIILASSHIECKMALHIEVIFDHLPVISVVKYQQYTPFQVLL